MKLLQYGAQYLYYCYILQYLLMQTQEPNESSTPVWILASLLLLYISVPSYVDAGANESLLQYGAWYLYYYIFTTTL
jgi:hypothetical protein